MNDTERPLVGIPCRQGRHGQRSTYFNLQTYCEAVAAAGGLPVLVPLQEEESVARALLSRLDGLLLAGGGDVAPAAYGRGGARGPVRVDARMDRVESRWLRWAIADDTPVLAICRGIQVLNAALGGTLVLDIATDRPGSLAHQRVDQPRGAATRNVEVAAGTHLARIVGPGELAMNSLHHQAIDRLAPGLLATANAPDGIIEAAEVPDRAFVVAVQWHSEEMWRDASRHFALFQAFVAATRQRRPG